MKKLREILRLRLEATLSMRDIQKVVSVSLGAIQGICKQAAALELNWEKVQLLSDQQLTERFYSTQASPPSTLFDVPDWREVHRKLSRKGMTKQFLWEEYAEQHPHGCYSYSRYCRLYSAWVKKQKRSMRQVHKAGEKCFVNYAGQTVPIVNRTTGELDHTLIFVAVLGASNYIFAEATRSQKLIDWTGSHVIPYLIILLARPSSFTPALL